MIMTKEEIDEQLEICNNYKNDNANESDRTKFADDYALDVEDIINEALNNLNNKEFNLFLKLVIDTVGYYK